MPVQISSFFSLWIIVKNETDDIIECGPDSQSGEDLTTPNRRSLCQNPRRLVAFFSERIYASEQKFAIIGNFGHKKTIFVSE
jgi:hypothetical protein